MACPVLQELGRAVGKQVSEPPWSRYSEGRSNPFRTFGIFLVGSWTVMATLMQYSAIRVGSSLHGEPLYYCLRLTGSILKMAGLTRRFLKCLPPGHSPR